MVVVYHGSSAVALNRVPLQLLVIIMPTNTSIYQLTPLLSPRPDLLENLVRVWREARANRLQFLTDLHTADEDAAYLSRAVLPENQVWIAEVDAAIAGFIAFTNGW